MGAGCSRVVNDISASISRLPSLPLLRRHSPLALSDRAVPLQFLELLVDLKPFPKVSNRKLGDLFTRDLVSEFIKPLTAKCKLCYIEALREGHVRLPWTTVDEECGTVRFAIGAAQAVGASTYFVSHAWSYRFKDLVQLIKQHAAIEGDGQDTLYWLDILAVTQNFTGKFENHIDGDFASVIRASRGLLLTIHPFVQVISAVELGKPLELVIDPVFGKTRAYDTKVSLIEVGLKFESGVISVLDVNNSEATVEADKTRILGLVRSRPGGIPHFNEMLKTAMRAAVKDALLMEAVYSGDVTSAETFVKTGAKIRCRSVAPPATLLANSAKVLAMALRSGSEIKGIHLIGSNAMGSSSSLPEATSKAIAKLLEAIDSSNIVTELSLARLGISDIDAAQVGRSIAKISCPLRYLDVSGNNFGEEGIVALSHGFADNHSRTGSLTKILIDMPRGANRDRERLKAAVLASSPHVTWVSGRVAGGTAGGMGALGVAPARDTGSLDLVTGASNSSLGLRPEQPLSPPVKQQPRVGAAMLPTVPSASSSTALAALSSSSTSLQRPRSARLPAPRLSGMSKASSTSSSLALGNSGLQSMMQSIHRIGASITSSMHSSSSNSMSQKRTKPTKQAKR